MVANQNQTMVCDECQKVRTEDDWLDYSPMQVVMNSELGWYNGDDGEICGPCMDSIMRQQ